MKRSDITVEVRDKNLNRLGVVPQEFVNLGLKGEHSNVGTWTLTLPYEFPLVTALRTPGSGIIVTGPVGVIMSGPTLQPELAITPEDVGGTITFSGISDDVVLADMLAFPEPSNPDPETQTQANDIREAAAETVIHQFVDANIGPSAPTERQRGITMGTDGGRGGTIRKSARFQQLGALIGEIAAASNLGFRVYQDGTDLLFQTYEIVDRTGFIRLDARNGTLAGQRVAIGAPGATRVIVAGQGEGVDRMILYADTTESLAAEVDWARRIERFVDQRQTADPAELQAAADEVLAEEGGTKISVQAVPVENENMRYGIDWFVGDLVSVVVNDEELPAIVTGYTLKLDADGLRIGATIGAIENLANDTLPRQVQAIGDRVSNLERNPASVPPGTLAPFAGASAPVGWLLCDGASYAESRYPELFATIGTTFGTSGAGTFHVPDMRGKFPFGADVLRDPGTEGGSESVVLDVNNVPPHNHDMSHTHEIKTRETGPGSQDSRVASAGGIGTTRDNNTAPVSHGGNTGNGAGQGLASDPVDVLNPFLALNFIIKT